MGCTVPCLDGVYCPPTPTSPILCSAGSNGLTNATAAAAFLATNFTANLCFFLRYPYANLPAPPVPIAKLCGEQNNTLCCGYEVGWGWKGKHLFVKKIN